MGEKRKASTWILATSPFFILLAITLSVLIGTKEISLHTAWQAITHFDGNLVEHNIVRSSRIPRVVAALFVGAFLAVAGAIMQGITRNYLASPSIMGVNDGSAFVITMAIVFIPGLSNTQMIVLSMLGSALGAALVFGFGSLVRGGLSPVRLAIIGTVIGTFLSSVASAIAMYFQVSQSVSIWYNARLYQVKPDMLWASIPFACVGLLLALLCAKSITVTSLGEEVAISLGQRTRLIKAISILSVVILTGTAVAIVGKIAFVGLIIPHITRFLVGNDYRFIIPCSAVIGAWMLAICDVLARLVNPPFETPIGVITAMIGIPFFLYLIRKKGGQSNA